VAALAGLAGLAVGILFALSVRDRIAPQSDLWDYAQEARQLARGEGFTSLYTYPVHLRPGETPPFPVRWRLPLYAVLGAAMLRAGVPLPDGFLYLGAATHAVLVALIALLAMRLAGRLPVRGGPEAGRTFGAAGVAGAAAAACALLCPLFLDSYNPGMSQTLAAALGLSVWVIALGGGGWGATILAAAAASAAWYLRGESVLFAPLWAWAIAGAPGRGGKTGARSSGLGHAAAFLIAYAALCVPWLVALRISEGSAAPLQGNPMLLYTHEYPGYSSTRSLGASLPGPLAYVLGNAGSFALRYLKDLVGYLLDLIGGLGPVSVVLLVAGAVIGAARILPLPLALAVPWQVLALSALERGPRFLVPVAPIACAAVGIAGASLFASPRARRFLLAIVGVLVVERAAALAHQRADAHRKEPPLPGALARALAPRARAWPRQALLLTDVPDWAAWHLDRPALLMPLSRDLNRSVSEHAVSGILLSPRARARNIADADTAWVRVIDRGDSIAGFDRPEPLPGGTRWYARAVPERE
jgi:hypothetical protein